MSSNGRIKKINKYFWCDIVLIILNVNTDLIFTCNLFGVLKSFYYLCRHKNITTMKIHKDQVVVNTKVSADAYAKLQSICQEKGLTIYNLFQMLADVIIRYMDSEHNLSADLQRIIRMFEGMNGWRNANNLADSMQDSEVVGAVYIIGNRKKKGERMVYVSQPICGEQQATYNVQTIFERIIEVVNPSLYRHLRLLAVDMGTDSMLDTMGRLADLYQENPDERELRIMFENNNWAENARQIDTTQQYKRKVTTSMEDFEREIQMEYL